MPLIPSSERVSIQHADRESWLESRTRDITSTECACLFGFSPYGVSYFDLWHAKKSGDRREIVEDQRMKRGKQLERAIAEMYDSDMYAGAGYDDAKTVNVVPFPLYIRLQSNRIGSSFDFVANDRHGTPLHLVECKNVDLFAFKNGWTVTDDFVEAPPYIEFQVQHQMLVSGIDRAVIVALVGGNDLRVIEREADPVIHREILARAAKFWASIDANEPPDPVFPGDAESVIRLRSYAEPGRLLDLRDDPAAVALFDRLARAKAAVSAAEDEEMTAKALLLERIGDAEKALFPGGTVSAGMVAPCSYTVNRAGYRNVRLNLKKGTKE